VTFGGFNNTMIGREPVVVGTLFESKKGDLVGPVKGNYGVYVAVIDDITPAPEKADLSMERMQQESGFANRATGQIYDVIKKAAKIKDNRKNYF